MVYPRPCGLPLVPMSEKPVCSAPLCSRWAWVRCRSLTVPNDFTYLFYVILTTMIRDKDHLPSNEFVFWRGNTLSSNFQWIMKRKSVSVFSATSISSLPTDNHVVIPVKPTEIGHEYSMHVSITFYSLLDKGELGLHPVYLKLTLLTKDLGKLSKAIHNKLHSFFPPSLLFLSPFLPSSFSPSFSPFHGSKNPSHEIYLLYKLLRAHTNNC